MCRGHRLFCVFFIASASAVLWLITVPIWEPFFRVVQRLENPGEIFAIAARLVPFYVAYAGSAVIDNIFIGLGKTEYNAVNSLLMNLGYYGVFLHSLPHACNCFYYADDSFDVRLWHGRAFYDFHGSAEALPPEKRGRGIGFFKKK